MKYLASNGKRKSWIKVAWFSYSLSKFFNSIGRLVWIFVYVLAAQKSKFKTVRNGYGRIIEEILRRSGYVNKISFRIPHNELITWLHFFSMQTPMILTIVNWLNMHWLQYLQVSKVSRLMGLPLYKIYMILQGGASCNMTPEPLG